MMDAEKARVRMPLPTPKEISNIATDGGEEFNRLVFEKSPYYGYGWWLYEFEGKKVFTMNGHRGQFVISFPDENIIIVRQGEFNNKVEEGNGTSDLQHYITEGYKIASSIN